MIASNIIRLGVQAEDHEGLADADGARALHEAGDVRAEPWSMRQGKGHQTTKSRDSKINKYKHIHIYIYIYIHTSLYLYLSLSIYIYIYIRAEPRSVRHRHVDHPQPLTSVVSYIYIYIYTHIGYISHL